MHMHLDADEPLRSARGPTTASSSRPALANAVATLQRSVGNGAVSQLLDRTRAPAPPVLVQRCGPVPCDCGPEEREEAQAHLSVARSALPPGATVQRAASDFLIRGKHPLAAAMPDVVFFDVGQSSPDSAERAKIVALATPAGRPLTLRGTASEEGSPARNATIVGERISAVSAVLTAAGHTAAKTPEALQAAGAGNIDYRRARSVEIRPSGAASASPDCSAGAAPNDCGPAPSPFTTALARAHTMIATARAKIAGPPDTATADLLTRLFGSASVIGTVDANLAAIDAQLTHMTPFGGSSGHRCVNNCDAGCGSGSTAYNQGEGAGALMTLCPIFVTEPGLDERAGVLFHEATHATPGLAAGDQSYVWQRLITQLPPALALSNADSYTAFVRLVTAPGSITLGPPVPDSHAGMSPGEQSQADRAVAWVQQWVMGTSSEVSSTYGVAHESIAAGSWTNGYYEDAMAFLAPAFGLTAPPAVPTEADKVALAGISDRYEQMLSAVSDTLMLQKAPVAGVRWEPGPGTTVRFGASFFTLSPRDQVVTLLRALIAVTPTISSRLRSGYLSVVHSVETHQGLGSP